MQLIFIYGQPASGKLTVGKALAASTGIALFHNHLIVDAVAAAFPFGSEAFVRLRERFWLDVFQTAAAMNRSLIFTFAPESTVAEDFPKRAAEIVEAAGGRVLFICLCVTAAEQERRLVSGDRAAFGKLKSLDLLHQLRADFAACMASMPTAALTIDTTQASPAEAAAQIVEVMKI
jgi:hypothetical protein